jgi:hypothetical protein
MSDRVQLARELAAGTKPRFIDTNSKSPKVVDEKAKREPALEAGSSEARYGVQSHRAKLNKLTTV